MIIEKIKQELEEFNKKKESLTKELRKEFPTLLQPLLQQCEEINNISWTQYTPYFNDGDECVFGVNTNYIDVNGKDTYELEDYESKYSRKDRQPNNLEKTVDDIIEVLSSIPDEFYRELFGDHCKITVYKDGKIETEEYEHD